MSKKKTSPRSHSTGRAFTIFLLALFFIGLAASVYLTNLHLLVHDPDEGPVDSFCDLSAKVSCVTVADSEYSTVFGIPVSMYGVEYFALGLLILLLSGAKGGSGFSRSFLFWMTAASLPVCAILGYIAAVKIDSICILCAVVYGVNIISFAGLLIAERADLRGLLTEAPQTIISGVKGKSAVGIGFGLLILFGITQYVWLPNFFEFDEKQPQAGNFAPGAIYSGRTLGDLAAPVRIEEFTDFQCPHCGRAHAVILGLMADFPGKIRLEHRDMPLDMACNPKIEKPFHANACNAAIWATCAAEQNRFWPFEHLLFENRTLLDAGHLADFANQAGLDMIEMEKCVSDGAILSKVIADITEGHARGVTGTPSVFVNGEMIVGYKDRAFWETKLRQIAPGEFK
jgi:uncharacterized membrane protein/predicted DsbA family dithiol-disulfide isomerase